MEYVEDVLDHHICDNVSLEEIKQVEGSSGGYEGFSLFVESQLWRPLPSPNLRRKSCLDWNMT